jgi:hypothetical protein
VLEPLAGLGQLKEVVLAVWRWGDHKGKRQPQVLTACKKLRARLPHNTVLTVDLVE